MIVDGYDTMSVKAALFAAKLEQNVFTFAVGNFIKWSNKIILKDDEFLNLYK